MTASVNVHSDASSDNPTRRRFLKHAPAAALAATGAAVALPAMAAPTGTDPHVAWWREARELEREADEIGRQMDDIWHNAPPTPDGSPRDWPEDIRARYDAYMDAHGFLALEEQRGAIWGAANRILDRIAATPPLTLEGAAIVAAVLLANQELMGTDGAPADVGGATLANFVEGLAGRAA
jgi:hypothetical protein